MQAEHNAGSGKESRQNSGPAVRSERGSPKQDSAERQAQHKYRAKIHHLLDALQRLVRPKDQGGAGKRLRNGQMSKTAILTRATDIIRQILIDDEALEIAKTIQEKDARNRTVVHRESSHILSQQSQVDFEIPATSDDSPEEAEFNLDIPKPASRQGIPVVSLSAVSLDQRRSVSSKLAEPSEPAPNFFLDNWVGIVTPSGNEAREQAASRSCHLVPELDSPDETVSQASLVAWGRLMPQ